MGLTELCVSRGSHDLGLGFESPDGIGCTVQGNVCTVILRSVSERPAKQQARVGSEGRSSGRGSSWGACGGVNLPGASMWSAM